jgi:acyl-CoA thioesterase FadM
MIENENPAGENLFKLKEQIAIAEDMIDRNGHVNHGKFIVPLCEDGRTHYFEKLFGSLSEFKEKYGLLPMIKHMSGDYLQQIFEGEIITVNTSAVSMKSHLLFMQSIFKGENLAAKFSFIEVLVDERGILRRVPQEITTKLNELNSKTR